MATEKDEKVQKKGRVAGCDLTDEQLNDQIARYKTMTEAGAIELPSWSDFVARAGLTEAVCAEVMERGADGPYSAYYTRARALGDFWQWCRGQYMSNPAWSATAARCQKALAMYRMTPGGEERARPAATAAKSGPSELVITFGGNDRRAREAGD